MCRKLFCTLLRENGGERFLILGDEERLFIDETDESGDCARGLLDEADRSVVHGNVRRAARFAEVCGELGGEVECLLARCTAVCPQDDV